MSQNSDFPILSIKERDRRFAMVNQLMDEMGLDVLVLTEGGGRIWRHMTINQFYLSNEPDGMSPIVVFPRHSEPVHYLLRPHFGVVQSDIIDGLQPWISDVRLSEPDPATCIAELFKERGLEKSRVGVVAAAASNPFPWMYGSLQDPLWQIIEAQLPDIDAVDIAFPFSLKAMTRSEEEIALARAAGRAVENAAKAVMDVAKIGCSEIDLYAAGVEALARGGVDEQFFILTINKEVLGLHVPRWNFPKSQPRILEEGDIAMFEYFPIYGGVDVQLQLGVHFGEAPEDIRKMNEVGRAAYEAGNAALKPGVPFKDVWQPMMDVITDAGCWSWGPGIHALPLTLMGPIQAGLEGHEGIPEAFKDLKIWEWGDRGPIDEYKMEEGMLFANEPGIGLGRKRIYQGNTVICRPGGAEELTTIGRDLICVE